MTHCYHSLFRFLTTAALVLFSGHRHLRFLDLSPRPPLISFQLSLKPRRRTETAGSQR